MADNGYGPDNGDIPIIVTEDHLTKLLAADVHPHVHFEGLATIDRRALEKGVKELESSQTVHELVGTTEKLTSHWVQSGLFRRAFYNLEPAADGGSKDVVVNIEVEEARPSKSIGVFTTDGAVPEIRAGLKNILGGKYSLELNYIPPTARLHSWSCSLVSNVPWLGRTAEYYLGTRTETKTLHPADAERVDELRATARNDESSLSVGYQRRSMAARNMTDVPDSLRKDFECHGKAYVRHEMNINRTKSHSAPILNQIYPLPVAGYELNVTSEVCGGILGGLPCFHKWEGQFTKFWSITPLVSFQWGCKLGSIEPLSKGRIPLSDRLFLSHRHVRGYKTIGPSTFDNVGDTTRFAATGGNALWATTASLNFPFLGFPTNGMAAMHLFADWGNLRMINTIKELTNAKEWLSTSKGSVGVGIVITRIPLLGITPNGRFELNFSLPLKTGKAGGPDQSRLFDKVKFGLVWSSVLSM